MTLTKRSTIQQSDEPRRVAVAEERDMPGGMARRPDDAKVEAAARDLLAAVERAVRVRDLNSIHHARAAAVQAAGGRQVVGAVATART